MRTTIYLVLLCVCLLPSCVDRNPNLDDQGNDIIDAHQQSAEVKDLSYHDTVYVPIYSDIYSDSRSQTTLLTATLSIRSTSLRDTTYINTIDYYNTDGKLVRSLIKNALVLAPMQSIDYVIDRDDTSGGTGANFIVAWGAQSDTRPLIQAVMIGTSGQHGLSFVTEGVSIKKQ